MQNMTNFYTQLAAGQTENAYLTDLAKLTELHLDLIQAIQSEDIWGIWKEPS